MDRRGWTSASGGLAALGLALCAWSPLRAGSWPAGVPRRPLNPVTDLAGVLSPATVSELDTGLRRQWAEGHFQLAVLTVPSLDGVPISDFSIRVARGWALGGKRASNGVLLLLATKDRRARIEVGSRLEGDLPDILCRRIIADVMAPRLHAGDTDAAVLAGAAAITATLAPQDPLAARDHSPDTGTGNPGGAVVAGGLLGLLLWFAGQPLFWLLLVGLLASILGSGGGLGGGFGGFGGFGGGGFGGGGFGGGGFGGGGFSGGGGGFSGGGASGGW